MVFFLRTSGLFSSSILIIAGIQITSIQQEEIVQETLFNQVGTIVIGLGCFTGPLLFGIASLIDQEPQKAMCYQLEDLATTPAPTEQSQSVFPSSKRDRSQRD